MNWLKSIKKLTRWRLVFLEKNQKPTLVVLVAFLRAMQRSIQRSFPMRAMQRSIQRSVEGFLGGA